MGVLADGGGVCVSNMHDGDGDGESTATSCGWERVWERL